MLAVTPSRLYSQMRMIHNPGPARGFFGILAEHGFKRIDEYTARKGLIEITLRCHPPTLDLTIQPASGYAWISTRLRHISPLLTRPREAAELAMRLGAELLGDLNKAQSTMTHH